MKTIKKQLMIISILLVVIFASLYVYASGQLGQTYYTRVNIWYEKPNKILSTNYHRGTIIPVGTKVTILKIGDDKISFTKEGSPGVTFTIANIRKYSLVSTEELFDCYFSEKDPKRFAGEFSRLSSMEKKNITNGTIAQGMTKEATIMAYGYPPKHKTPNVTSNVWLYWINRYNKVQVTFNKNKIINIMR